MRNLKYKNTAIMRYFSNMEVFYAANYEPNTGCR